MTKDVNVGGQQSIRFQVFLSRRPSTSFRRRLSKEVQPARRTRRHSAFSFVPDVARVRCLRLPRLPNIAIDSQSRKSAKCVESESVCSRGGLTPSKRLVMIWKWLAIERACCKPMCHASTHPLGAQVVQRELFEVFPGYTEGHALHARGSGSPFPRLHGNRGLEAWWGALLQCGSDARVHWRGSDAGGVQLRSNDLQSPQMLHRGNGLQVS